MYIRAMSVSEFNYINGFYTKNKQTAIYCVLLIEADKQNMINNIRRKYLYNIHTTTKVTHYLPIHVYTSQVLPPRMSMTFKHSTNKGFPPIQKSKLNKFQTREQGGMDRCRLWLNHNYRINHPIIVLTLQCR